MQNSGRLLRHKRRNMRVLLSAFLSLLFILSLFSCGTPKNDDSAESESPTTTESTSVDDSALLYYTTLVSRLEEEILQLKEKIFLLQHQGSIPVDQPSDTDSTLTSTPTEEVDYVYEIIDGGAVIVTYRGKGGDVGICKILRNLGRASRHRHGDRLVRLSGLPIAHGNRRRWGAFIGRLWRVRRLPRVSRRDLSEGIVS